MRRETLLEDNKDNKERRAMKMDLAFLTVFNRYNKVESIVKKH